MRKFLSIWSIGSVVIAAIYYLSVRADLYFNGVKSLTEGTPRSDFIMFYLNHFPIWLAFVVVVSMAIALFISLLFIEKK